jgi:hypothetical protein
MVGGEITLIAVAATFVGMAVVAVIVRVRCRPDDLELLGFREDDHPYNNFFQVGSPDGDSCCSLAAAVNGSLRRYWH